MIHLHVCLARAARCAAVLTLAAVTVTGCASSTDDGAGSYVPPSASGAASTAIGSTVADSSAALPSYVVVSGDTLIGIATGAGVTVDELIEANSWAEGPARLLLPGDVIALPQHAARVSEATTPASSGTSSTHSSGTGSYREVTGDRLLHWGDDGMTDAIEAPLSDGTFYASRYTLTSDGSAVQFELARFISADACIEAMETVPEGTVDHSDCAGGYADMSATDVVRLPLDSATPVIVVTGDYRFFEITAREFGRLIEGDSPSPDAPAAFEYAPYWDALVEVANGNVVRANQQPSS